MRQFGRQLALFWARAVRGGFGAAIAAGVWMVAGVASAAVTPVTNDGNGAAALAGAITQNPAFVTSASFDAVPTTGTPHATADSALAGFPTNGASYAVLTTGSASGIEAPQSNQQSITLDGTAHVRGNTDYDVTVLRIALNVPSDANCLSISFRFFSEEFPEFVGKQYNDAFIAELDTSDWTTSGSAITAPQNFAFDQNNNVISINAVGPAAVSAAAAAGTVYDAATPLLSASKPITAGAHTLFLSLFDQGDAQYDSAVFVDNLVLGTAAAGSCVPGATTAPPPTTTTTPPATPPTSTPTTPTTPATPTTPNIDINVNVNIATNITTAIATGAPYPSPAIPATSTLQFNPQTGQFFIRIKYRLREPELKRLCRRGCPATVETRSRAGQRLFAGTGLPGDGAVLGSKTGIKIRPTKGKLRIDIPINKSRLLSLDFNTVGGFRVGETRTRVVLRTPAGDALTVRDGRIRVSIDRIKSGALPGLQGILAL
jgi:hypothetical protein